MIFIKMSKFDVDINELIILVQAVEVGIYKKVYTREELTKYFPAWNNLTSKLEKITRQNAVEKLYREEPAPVPEEKIEEKESNPTKIVVPE